VGGDRGHHLLDRHPGGALFAAAAPRGRLRVTGAVVGWYLLVAFLHGLWDASRGIAVWLTLLLTATPVQWMLIQQGRVPEPTTEQVQAFTATTWVLLGLDALLGLAVLRGRWRRSQALQPTSAVPTPPRPTLG
jgi:protease PrsW